MDETEFRKDLDLERDSYFSLDEKNAFLDGVRWMLERSE